MEVSILAITLKVLALVGVVCLILGVFISLYIIADKYLKR